MITFLGEFLAELEKQKGKRWVVEGDGAIRTAVELRDREVYCECPISSICNMHFEDFIDAAENLGIFGPLRDKIVRAVDAWYDLTEEEKFIRSEVIRVLRPEVKQSEAA